MSKYFLIIYKTLSDMFCILVVVNGTHPVLRGGGGQRKLCSQILENYMILTPMTTVKLNKNSCTGEVQDSVSGYIQKI